MNKIITSICFTLLVAMNISMAFAQEGSSANIARSTFTTEIIEREPADTIDTLSNDASDIFFFTDIRNSTNRSVVHRWEYNGDIMAEVEFNVGGPRWRVWSSKKLMPHQTGEWTVTIIDDQGQELVKKTFTYQEASQAPMTTQEEVQESTEMEEPATSMEEGGSEAMEEAASMEEGAHEAMEATTQE